MFATKGLLLVALLNSSLELHSQVPHPDQAAAPDPVMMSPEAQHPDAPTHVESATSSELDRCNTCLLQRNLVSGPLPALKTAGRIPSASAIGRGLCAALRSQVSPHRSSRAPPAA